MSENLVSTEWLAEHLDAPDVVVIDGSWYMPADPRNARDMYLEEHIPGAIHFDIDTVCDRNSDLPHMLPRPEAFSSAMRKMGIGDGQRIVVYDGMGLFSAARVWWTFRAFGVKDVVILDGGLAKWKEESRPVEEGEVRRPERHFTARLDHGLVADMGDVRQVLGKAPHQVLDARSAGRFAGTEQEPRAGLKSGRMPESRNIPFLDLLDRGRLKNSDDLKAVFSSAEFDMSKPVVATCGSGVSACVIALALSELGHKRVSVYDGSWTEWASDPENPIDTD